MAVKERSQIKGTDAQIKAFAGHNGVLAFATDTKSLHVLSGTAGTTTEFLPSNKLATVATSGSYNDLSDKPVVDSALSATSENPVQNKVINSALDGKLSTSGGTITGDITLTGERDFMSATSKGGRLGINTTGASLQGSNVDYQDGASLLLRSSSYPNDQKGMFYLLASLSSSQNCMLAGYPSGALTWDGNEVVRVVSSGKSADGTQWYRKYNDGYIEQGGYYDKGSDDHILSLSITFLTPFSSANYSITANSGATTGELLDGTLGIFGKSATGVLIKFWGVSSDIKVRYLYWHACGY